MKTSLMAALVLIAAPAAAEPRPSNEPVPIIHPNDRSAANVQQRVDEIRLGGDVRDQPQMNALESLQQQSRGSSPALAPIPPAHRPVPDRAPLAGPGEWPGYRPGYLPRQ